MKRRDFFESDTDYIIYLERRVHLLERMLHCNANKMYSTEIQNRTFEMSYNKKQYKNFVYNIYPQIAQNWCLCMYCKLYRPDLKSTYLHWRSELETHIVNLNSEKIDNSNTRTKMTLEAMVIDADLDEPDVVFKCCYVKFRHENENEHPLNISSEHQKEVCRLFAEDINNIVACIGSDNIFEYTRTRFPNDY